MAYTEHTYAPKPVSGSHTHSVAVSDTPPQASVSSDDDAGSDSSNKRSLSDAGLDSEAAADAPALKAARTAASAAKEDDAQASAPSAAADDDDKDDDEGCAICLEPFSDPEHIAVNLTCCDMRVCSQCICAHLLSKDVMTEQRLSPKCPFCIAEFVLGSNQVVVAFNRYTCRACAGPVSYSNKTCATPTCFYFRKQARDCTPTRPLCGYSVPRFSWVLAYTPTSQTEAGLYVTLSDSVLLSHNSGPTLASSRYLLRPDGGITHIHADGTEQAWNGGGLHPAPQWFPLMASTAGLFPTRNPR